MRKLTIGSRVIDDSSPCFVIAEIGNNHQGDLNFCKEMFRVAKECQVDAVKLQKRNNRKLYTQKFFDKPYDNPNSYGPTYGIHREALEFGMTEYKELKDYAHELGLMFFVSAFDESSTDFLMDVGVDLIKIASGDLRSIPLLRHVAQCGVPMMVSTGGATMEDVELAYETIMPINQNFSLLQCTAAYPASYEHLDLRVIETYRERFPDTVIGLSDHDNGIAMALLAYHLGARVIEKHFTLKHASKGTDHVFSLEPAGMKKLVRDLQRTRIALGDGIKKIHPEEKDPIIKMSKKLVAARNLPTGRILTAEDIAMKCPGDGVSAKEYDKFLGKCLTRDVSEDENLLWEIVQ